LSKLFGRSCSVLFTATSRAGTEERFFDGTTAAALSQEPTRGNLRETFRIAFNVELTSEKNANACSVSIYNLNRSSRSFLELERRPRLSTNKTIRPLTLTLKAGLGPNPEILFQGQIDGEKTRTEKSGPDVITTVECGDGRFALRNTVINKTFAPGVSLEQAIEHIRDQLGVGKSGNGNNWLGITKETFSQGLTMSGSAPEILDQLATKQDLDWSIQDNKLQIKPKGQPIKLPTLIISPDTGLLSIPKRTNYGVEFSILLDPAIRPGRPVEVQSMYLNQDRGSNYFIVKRVQTQGDNFTGAWASTVQASNPNTNIKVFK